MGEGFPDTRHDAILNQVERITASRAFAGSARMCRFLRFAVLETLAGRGSQLKEYSLGVAIYDRTANFDPRLDPIVRVEARRLRSKLKSYYERDGAHDDVIVELPTGTYAPLFHLRCAPAPVASAEGAGGIVLLPFANLSPEPDSEYFSDGLTEELIHALTRAPGLRVVAWNSSSQFKDRPPDIPAIGRELGVAWVLSGAVRRSAGRLRITARLIDTASGAVHWSEVFDRGTEDLFAIQEEISRAIASNLRIHLLGATPAPRNLEAYDLYLRGRFHWNKRTHDGLRLATELFQKAIDASPDYAPAYAGLADAHLLLADHGLAWPAEMMRLAKKAARKAIALDPGLAEPYASLGFITSLHEWDWAGGGRHYRRAMDLNPACVIARHWYAVDYLAMLGRFDEAVRQCEEAVRLDPLSRVTNEGVAYILLLARRYDEALARYEELTEIDPYFFRCYTARGRVYLHMGVPEKAIEMFLKGREFVGEIPTLVGALGQAYGMAGRETEARQMLDKLNGIASERYVPSTSFALLHCGLGEVGKALDWLELAHQRKELTLSAIKVHPGYDRLRGEARFGVLLEKVGFGGC